MIKTEKEYLEAKKKFKDEQKVIEAQKKKLKKAGLSKEQIRLAIDPLESFTYQSKEEIEEYEKIKRGDFDDLKNLYGIGRMIVAIRIFKGIKQSELALRIGVKESQISRDEANEYHGASLEKIQKVLEAMGVVIESKVKIEFKDAV